MPAQLTRFIVILTVITLLSLLVSSRPIEVKEISSCNDRVVYQKYYKSQNSEAAYRQAIREKLERRQTDPNCKGSGKVILQLYR